MVGLPQHVRPPGIPGKTPEIAGVTQFMTGHNGSFSTLQGYWDRKRGAQLNNDLPLLLGINQSRSGMFLLEGGALSDDQLAAKSGAIPIKGNYNQVGCHSRQF
jgi:hypothetical protein